MKYDEYAAAHKSTEFAPFLKSRYVKSFPLRVEIVSVDQQKLPQTGDSLVARIKYDAKLKAKLKPDYIAALETVKAKDIGFPLNKTNQKAFVEIFGNETDDWHGVIQFMSVPVNDPKSGKLVQGLVVLTEGTTE